MKSMGEQAALATDDAVAREQERFLALVTGDEENFRRFVIAKLTYFADMLERFEPMLDRYQQVTNSNGLRQARKALRNGR